MRPRPHLLGIVALVAITGTAGCRVDDNLTPTPLPDAIAGTPLRVATFNVRRFFDTLCESGACEAEDYEALPSAAYFEQRATQLAEAIRSLDADLVAVQEIETQACLDALSLRLRDVMPHGTLGEIGLTASVDVAILSRRPFERVVGHRETTPLLLPDGTQTSFSRELLEVTVRTTGGHAVALFAAHFKAKANDDPPRRLAEAIASSVRVNELAAREPDTVVLLAGDLNDTPGSPPLNALTVDGGLVRLADDLQFAEQATYTFDGRGQAIDHVLLAPGSPAIRIPRSARAWRDPGQRGWGGSDHAALTADLVLPDR